MLQVGATSAWERTFTEEDVRLFAKISGDEGIHHIQPDEQGRIMVPGLRPVHGHDKSVPAEGLISGCTS
jgi:acyl dehydratase